MSFNVLTKSESIIFSLSSISLKESNSFSIFGSSLYLSSLYYSRIYLAVS
jgi:hypothetical protein